MDDHQSERAGTGGRTGPIRTIREHLMPSGRIPGTEPSDTVWTGCDGPEVGSARDRWATCVGIASWLLVGFLAVWLHLTQLDGFVDAFPLVIGAKVLVFLWVLFGVAVLRPLFLRKSRGQAPDGGEA
ncbi:MAG: hypothetical protein ACO3CR_05635 [Solirubrobacterales bacterium]